MSWVSPTGHDDDVGCWTNETNAYDGHTGTKATWTPSDVGLGGALFLTIDTISSNKIRFYASRLYDYIDNINVYVYDVDVGNWRSIYYGSFTSNTWIEKSFATTYNINKARVRFNLPVPSADYGYLHEFEFWQLSGGMQILTLRTMMEY